MNQFENFVKERTKQDEPKIAQSNPALRYLMLKEEDFRCLVRGGVITTKEGQQIALQDMGFNDMYDAIESAEKGIETYVGHEHESLNF